MSSAAESALTVVVARRIRPGCEAEYERTMREFVAWSLTRPGHEGLHVLRPAPDERDYTVMSHFHDEVSRRAFTDSRSTPSGWHRALAVPHSRHLRRDDPALP